MKHNYIPYLKFLLRTDMESKKLGPKGRIRVDSQRHTYPVPNKGKISEAAYIASRDNFGRNNDILFCEYGFIDSSKQHTFSKSARNYK